MSHKMLIQYLQKTLCNSLPLKRQPDIILYKKKKKKYIIKKYLYSVHFAFLELN